MAKRHLATIPAAGALLCLALGLAGCATEGPQTAHAPAVETAFTPDPKDPLGRWAHLIREASERYDMPEKWIRAVMMRESNGRMTTNNGKVLTSSAGAIGLMQVMPGTYDLMRWQYGLGANPADPHDNIMAGTAYLREMYDLFGAPGFLAAYNCGPACYAGHLAGKQRLPRETKMYLAALTPNLRGAAPREPSQSAGASAIEVAVVPADAPRSARTAGEVVVAMAPPPVADTPAVVPPAIPVAAPVAVVVEPKRMESQARRNAGDPCGPIPRRGGQRRVAAGSPLRSRRARSQAAQQFAGRGAARPVGGSPGCRGSVVAPGGGGRTARGHPLRVAEGQRLRQPEGTRQRVRRPGHRDGNVRGSGPAFLPDVSRPMAAGFGFA